MRISLYILWVQVIPTPLRVKRISEQFPPLRLWGWPALILWLHFPLSLSLFSFSVLVSLTHLFGSEGPVIQSRTCFSPSEVITFAWDSTHPHRSPGELRQADGSTLFLRLLCAVPQRNPAAGTAQRGWSGNYLKISVSEVAHISFSDSSTWGTQHRAKW